MRRVTRSGVSFVRVWQHLASGQPVALTADEAAELLSVLRASHLDGLPLEHTAELARRVLASVQGAPELFGG